MNQIFNTIPEVLSELEPNVETKRAVVFAAWLRCAGDKISQRTRPIAFDAKRLTIAVADETWRLHLQSLSSQLLGQINAAVGHDSVTFIEFRVDTTNLYCESLSRDADVLREAPPSLINAAEAIKDDNLRENFLAAAAVYLDKGRRA